LWGKVVFFQVTGNNLISQLFIFLSQKNLHINSSVSFLNLEIKKNFKTHLIEWLINLRNSFLGSIFFLALNYIGILALKKWDGKIGY